jgi:hypothetical protein
MAVTDEKPMIGCLADLLAELSVGPQITSQLDSIQLGELLELERLALLARLKTAEVPLGQRQKIANLLSSAKREGRIRLKIDKPPSTPRTADVCQPSAKAMPPKGVASTALGSGQHCRVFVISDAHSDHKANLEWIKTRLPAPRADAFDVCLCAGDVSDNPETLRESLGIFKRRFDEVVFAAGNHELWVRPRPVAIGPDTRTSFDRLDEVHRTCAEVGVHTAPLWLQCPEGAQDVLVVPLSSWYHDDWDREAELPADPADSDDDAGGRPPLGFREMWSDFQLCRWPPHLAHGSLALAEEFARRNDPALERLVAHLPPAPLAGRAAPSRRLTKEET